MHVLFYRHPSGVTNYGDELNLYLWDKLLPQEGSRLRPDLIFLGIGTLLNDKLAPGPKLVFGAGAGYGPPPKVDGSWDIRFVRGKLTARALGVSEALALGDPAAILGMMHQKAAAPTYPVSYMPRFTNADAVRAWAAVAGSSVHFIDPRWQPERVTDEIAASELLLSEALHGAVVADALRIPWVPIASGAEHDFKWQDWLSTLDMEYAPVTVGGPFMLGRAIRGPFGQLSNPQVAKRQLYALLTDLQKLREEIRQRRGPFAVDKEPRTC